MPKQEISSSSPSIQEQDQIKTDNEQGVGLCPICQLPLVGSYDHSQCQIATEETMASPAETILTPEQVKGQQELINCLSNGDIYSALEIRDQFALPAEVIQSPEVQAAAKEGLVRCLTDYPNNIDYALKIRGEFNLPIEVIQSPEVQAAAQQRLIKSLSMGYFDFALKIRDQFALPAEVVQAAAQQGLIKLLSDGYFGFALEIKNRFALPAEFIQSPEVQAAAQQGLINCLSNGNIDYTLKIRDQFALPAEVVQAAAQQELIKRLSYGDINSALKIRDEFNLSARNKETATNNNIPFAERQKAFDVLAGLAKNGEASITDEFSEIIKNRSKQKEVSESKWGLDQLQEAAFYTLIRLDNPESNYALFSLLDSENVNITVKYAALRKLCSEERNFLNDQVKQTLKEWFHSRPVKELEWQDLKFIRAILNNIPSSELRNKSEQSIEWSFGELSKKKQSINQIWQEKYNHIPENTFLQLYKFVQGEDILLDKFQELYSVLKKESTKKDNLLYSIVNSLDSDPQILSLMVEKLKEIDFTSKKDADLLSELLRQFVFLNKIEDIKNYQQETQTEKQELPPEILEIFSKEARTLKELTSIIKEVTIKKIQEILPNEDITGEKIEALEKEWGNLEPIFTYLARYPQLKEYMAEMVANFDNRENWKNWRYNLKNRSVEDQIGHLSKEQLEIWKEDYFSEIGDIMIAESGSDKPKQIQNILQDAIVRHKHIFNPELGQNKFGYVQKTLEDTYREINENLDQKEKILEEKAKEITTDIKSIDAIIDFNNLPKIKQNLENIIQANSEI